MNILWLHSHFLYPTGGTRFIYEVVTRLNKYHKINVCVEKAGQEWLKKYKDSDIPLHQISTKSSIDLDYWLFFPYFMAKEKKELQKYIDQSDVVVASIFPMHYLASFYNKPIIYYCFEPFAFFYDDALLSSLPRVKKIGSLLVKLAYEGSDKKGVATAERVMTFNHAVEDWMNKIYRRKADKITYLGVNADVFKRRKVSRPKKWSDNLLLLHSTDFTAMKGTEDLIKAMNFIAKSCPKAKLIITQTVNDREAKCRYELLIRELNLNNYIEFIGTIPPNKLPFYYSLADIFCFSADPQSIGTTASLSVLEAMSSGLPVVRSIGCDEEIIHGESGFLADPKKPEEYAHFVLELLNHKSLRYKMGSAGRSRILKFYQWNKVADIFLEEFQRFK